MQGGREGGGKKEVRRMQGGREGEEGGKKDAGREGGREVRRMQGGRKGYT